MPKTKLLPVFRTNFNTSFAVLITFLARNQEYIDAAAMTLRLACNDDLIFKDKEELEASSSSSKIAFKKSQLNEDERNILKMVEQDASESALMERIAINSRLQAVMRVNVKRVRPENAEKSATIIASLTSLISVFNEVKFDSEKLLTTSGEKVTFEEVRNSFMIIAESLEKDKILDASQWSLVEQIRIWVVEELSLAKTNIGKIFRKTGVNSFITTCGFFIQPLMEIYRNLLELKVDIDPQKNIKRIEVQANVRCLLILPVADPRMITYLNKISFYFEGMEQLTYLEKKEGFDFIQDGTEILLTLADEFNRDIEKPETTFAKKEAMLQLISRAMIEVYQKRLLQGKKVVKSVAGIKYLEFKLEPKDSVLEVKINGLTAIAAISQIVHKDKIVNENESLGEEYRRARSLMKNHQLEALSFSQTDHSLKKFYDLFCKYRKDHIKDFQSDVQLKTIVLNLFSETIHLAQLCEEKAKLSKDMKYKATNFKNAYNLYINSASMMQILFATKQLNVGVLQKPQYDTLSVFMLRYNEATGNEVENDGGIYGIFDALLSNIGKLQTQYPDLQNRKPSVEEVEMANQNTKLLEKEEQRLD
jgi:hypothetical protein